MKIKRSRLKEIIKEEVRNLEEDGENDDRKSYIVFMPIDASKKIDIENGLFGIYTLREYDVEKKP